MSVCSTHADKAIIAKLSVVLNSVLKELIFGKKIKLLENFNLIILKWF